MKRFNAGDASKRPSQIWKAARSGGAVVQHRDRSGAVIEEFVVLPNSGAAAWSFYQSKEQEQAVERNARNAD